MIRLPRTGLLLATLLSVTSATPHARAEKPAERAFEGWSDAVPLESRDASVKAVVVPGIGGRVMSYGFAGENILWINPDHAGKTLATAGADFSPGGFQTDLGPEVAALPAHPQLWAGPYALSNRKNKVLLMRAPED